MKKAILMTLACASSNWATGSWNQQFNYEGYAASGIQALTVKEKVYIFGGVNSSSTPDGHTEMWVYDTFTGHWTQGPSASGVGKNSYAAAECDGKFFYVGGHTLENTPTDSFSDIVVFDPEDTTQSSLGSWISHPVSALPSGVKRSGASAVCKDDHLYVYGGWSSRSSGNAVMINHATLYKIDVTAGSPTWSSLTSSSIARSLHSATIVDGKMIVTGGIGNTGGSYSPVLDSVEIYDFTADSWSSGTAMSTPRYWHSAYAEDDTLFVQGGIDYRPGGSYLASTAVYDSASDNWTDAAPMNQGRYGHTVAIVGAKAWVFGGGNSGGLEDVIESYFSGSPQVSWNPASNYIPRWNHYNELVKSVMMQKDNKIGLGNTSPTAKMDISGDKIRLRDSLTPVSSTEGCNPGEFAWDKDYLYICAEQDKWKRVSLSNF